MSKSSNWVEKNIVELTSMYMVSRLFLRMLGPINTIVLTELIRLYEDEEEYKFKKEKWFKDPSKYLKKYFHLNEEELEGSFTFLIELGVLWEEIEDDRYFTIDINNIEESLENLEVFTKRFGGF